MINKVLIALSAVLAVAAAMPFFDTGARGQGFEYEYENNENVWGNAPLKSNPFEYKAQMANELNQDDGVNVEGAEVANQEANAGDDSGDQDGAGAGGQAFGGAGAFADRGATFNGIVEPVAGGNSNDDDVADTPDTVAAVETGAGQGSHQGAGAQGAAVNNAPLSPVVDAADAAAVAGGGSTHVHAVGAPPPGELMSKSSGRGQGLGIAVGVSLLVVATAAVAVFAIRYHRRYRF